MTWKVKQEKEGTMVNKSDSGSNKKRKGKVIQSEVAEKKFKG